MTQGPALHLATGYLDAFTANDLTTVATYLAEDFRFDGPLSHSKTAEEFLAGPAGFASTLEPGWTKVAAFGDDREALLLYDLSLVTGATMRVADYYTVADGKIQSERILFDTHGYR